MMKRRVLTVFAATALAAGVFVGAMLMGSAIEVEPEPSGTPGSDAIYFPWVPAGPESDDSTDDVDIVRPYYGSVTVQNLEGHRIDLYFTATDGYDAEDFGGWGATKLEPYEVMTLTTEDLGIDEPGGGAVVVGTKEGENTVPARIAAVQKQTSAIAPGDHAETSDSHEVVGGYTGLQDEQLGEQAVLPIVQINSNWNTMIHITNFSDEDEADVQVQMNPAEGAGWSINLNREIGPGETESIDLLSLNPPAGWVGSATITADENVGAVAERFKDETNMLIMNVSQNPEFAGGTQSAPLVFDNWALWNTGISIADVSGASNDVTITYYDLDGETVGDEDFTVPANGMNFIYTPASLDDDDEENGDAGFVGSAVITSDGPIVGAVDEVKYFGDDPDTGHAMSYMVERHAAEAGESLAMPLVQRGDVDATGDTTGIQIFNPSDEDVVVALWYFDVDGDVFEDSPELISLGAKEGDTAYTMDETNMPAGFNGSAIIQVLAGDGSITAASNNVNYSVAHDGSSSYNLVRTTMAGPSLPDELIPAISIASEPEGDNEEATFELTAQLEDASGNPLLVAGVEIVFEIDEDGAVHAALFEAGEIADGDDTLSTTTDAMGQAFVDVIRDEPESEDDWLEDGFTATVTATIGETDIDADIELKWIEPEDTDL